VVFASPDANGELIFKGASIRGGHSTYRIILATPAALFAWRLCYSYLSVAVNPPPKVGSPEWHKQEEERCCRMRSGDTTSIEKRKLILGNDGRGV